MDTPRHSVDTLHHTVDTLYHTVDTPWAHCITLWTHGEFLNLRDRNIKGTDFNIKDTDFFSRSTQMRGHLVHGGPWILRNTRGLYCTYVGAVYSKHAEKMTKFNYMEIFRKMSEHFQKATCTSSMC